MYLPRHFTESDGPRIDALIRDYGFATLISPGADALQITHAPLQWNRATRELLGHLAAANPHAALLRDEAPVTALIHGPHGYVSPTWYVDENPRVPNVPTWNYAAVHLSGRARAIDDPAAKWQLVRDLAAQYESGENAWKPGTIENHATKLGAIACFAIRVESIEAKFKLSQNRSPADQQALIDRLETSVHPDARAMAALMRENLPSRRG